MPQLTYTIERRPTILLLVPRLRPGMWCRLPYSPTCVAVVGIHWSSSWGWVEMTFIIQLHTFFFKGLPSDWRLRIPGRGWRVQPRCLFTHVQKHLYWHVPIACIINICPIKMYNYLYNIFWRTESNDVTCEVTPVFIFKGPQTGQERGKEMIGPNNLLRPKVSDKLINTKIIKAHEGSWAEEKSAWLV